MKPRTVNVELEMEFKKTLFLVHVNVNVSTKFALSVCQLTLTDADRRFSNRQTLPPELQNAFSDARADEHDLQLSF